MIGIARISAVFSRDVPELAGLENIETVGLLNGRRTTGPAADYAERAFEIMSPDTRELGLVTICGPSGSTVKAFRKAWAASSDGTLTGEGFGEKRYKRIHPFTLVKSLQNQIPAALSMKYHITGPCLNLLDAATGLAHALPNIRVMLKRGPLLLVMASAGDREEESQKMAWLHPEQSGLEGAICLLLTGQAVHGSLEPGSGEATHPPIAAAPVLEPGLQILQAIAQGTSRSITLTDSLNHSATIQWRC